VAVNREAYKRGHVITGQAVPLIGAKETLQKVTRGLIAVECCCQENKKGGYLFKKENLVCRRI
jgi:hypothetical protein